VARQKKRPAPKTPSPETAPAAPNTLDGESAGIAPWTILQAAIKAVPALKYALAVLGIVSAISLIKGFGIDFRIAVFGTIIMVVLMVALVVFAALTKVKSPQVRSAALVLMWSFLALTILSAALLFTSAFFDYPKPLPKLLGLADRAEPKSSDQEPKHVTVEIGIELKTQIGTIRPQTAKEGLAAAGLADGLHDQFYTDRKRGFVLRLKAPENWSDWSIVQAKTTVDETGRPAQEFRFAPGLLEKTEIGIRTDDGVVGFLYTKQYRKGAASLFIYQLADQTGPVEDVVDEEMQKGLRIGIVWLVYQYAFVMAHPSAGLEESPGPQEDVKLSRIVVSPDHQNALLEWRTPHRMYGDIVGRVVVGAKGTYFVVAIRIDPTMPEDKKVNQDLQTMLESFQPI
jgi:hypothetical protein